MAKVKRSSHRQPMQFSRIGEWCHYVWRRTQRLLSSHRRFTVLLVLTLGLLLFVIVGSLLPSMQPVEGSLTLSSLTFTSATAQPFLRNARSITQLSTVGALPLKLTGQFKGDPTLNSRTVLELKPLSNANWQFEGLPGATVEITNFELAKQTSIKQLNYDTYNKRLTLTVRPAENAPATLTLSANGEFRVRLEGYQLPAGLSQELREFTWQPNDQITLAMQQPLELDLQFSQVDRMSFWGNLAVQQVQLKRAEVANEAYATNYKESAVIGGTIRLADKNYNLEEGQFVTFAPADSLRALLRLRLSEANPPTLKTSDHKIVQLGEAAQGLKVDVSGTTRRIEIGLNPALPVAKLQASWLEGWLPRDAAIALIAFLSSLLSMLLGWLFELAGEDDSA